MLTVIQCTLGIAEACYINYLGVELYTNTISGTILNQGQDMTAINFQGLFLPFRDKWRLLLIPGVKSNSSNSELQVCTDYTRNELCFGAAQTQNYFVSLHRPTIVGGGGGGGGAYLCSGPINPLII